MIMIMATNILNIKLIMRTTYEEYMHSFTVLMFLDSVLREECRERGGGAVIQQRRGSAPRLKSALFGAAMSMKTGGAPPCCTGGVADCQLSCAPCEAPAMGRAVACGTY
mmetsp:Transcript_14640/g.39912  ORF Transcript_14640/g.39912 Transcript_14640/m.39912 type:complete len:109 (-) Transcript_14640:322-648(-)